MNRIGVINVVCKDARRRRDYSNRVPDSLTELSLLCSVIWRRASFFMAAAELLRQNLQNTSSTMSEVTIGACQAVVLVVATAVNRQSAI